MQGALEHDCSQHPLNIAQHCTINTQDRQLHFFCGIIHLLSKQLLKEKLACLEPCTRRQTKQHYFPRTVVSMQRLPGSLWSAALEMTTQQWPGEASRIRHGCKRNNNINDVRKLIHSNIINIIKGKTNIHQRSAQPRVTVVRTAAQRRCKRSCSRS